MKKNELVIFETVDNAVKLEVPVEGETVWLNRQQMAELFNRDVKIFCNLFLNFINCCFSINGS